MSGKLAMSSVFSVFLMVGYVLFGGDVRPLDPGQQASPLPRIETPAMLPQASAQLLR